VSGAKEPWAGPPELIVCKLGGRWSVRGRMQRRADDYAGMKNGRETKENRADEKKRTFSAIQAALCRRHACTSMSVCSAKSIQARQRAHLTRLVSRAATSGSDVRAVWRSEGVGEGDEAEEAGECVVLLGNRI
jgi:hypothetical protein